MCNGFHFQMTGLVRPDAFAGYNRVDPLTGRVRKIIPRRDPYCQDCGTSPGSRFAMGDGMLLPLVRQL